MDKVERNILLTLLAVLLVALSLSFGCSAAACSEVGQATSRKTEWHVFSGCYVEVEGKMTPQSVWRRDDNE